jgi:hypothetical protein
VGWDDECGGCVDLFVCLFLLRTRYLLMNGNTKIDRGLFVSIADQSYFHTTKNASSRHILHL